jgi:hypothetical protein
MHPHDSDRGNGIQRRPEVSFADVSRIDVSASDDYEAWEFAGPSGLRMVSTPGGHLTVWQGDAP